MTGGISRGDMLGVLRVYDALFDSLGFRIYLLCTEFRRHATYRGEWACMVEATLTPELRYGKMLWMGTGHTQRKAREDVLRELNRKYGLPFAFSEEEVKMRIALAGEDAFRRACRNIEMFVGASEERQ